MQELALTRIDDSPSDDEDRFTQEEHDLIESIQYNIDLWMEESEAAQQ